jgi:hypothetical protein
MVEAALLERRQRRVVEMSGRVAGRAHHFEKSATNLADASIHRLASKEENLRKFGSLWLKTNFLTCGLTP